MEIVTANHQSEQGHYYTKDGKPAYTIIGANGKERNTTLRDCRKLDLVPSVTQILRCVARPGLDLWKQDQTILACLTMPRCENEPEGDYIARLKNDAKEQARRAAELGTQIHAQIQEGFEHGSGNPYYLSAREILDKECGRQAWIAEQSFAKDGFGGKADLHTLDYLVDVKSTDKDLATVKAWDEHALQLAAYRHGLQIDGARCFILYINVNTAESRLIEIPSSSLDKGLRMFMALRDYWRAKTGLGGENVPDDD